MFVGSRCFLASDVVGLRRLDKRRDGVDTRSREAVAPRLGVDVALLEEQREILAVENEGAVPVLAGMLATDRAQHRTVDGVRPKRCARAREEDTLPAAGGRV